MNKWEDEAFPESVYGKAPCLQFRQVRGLGIEVCWDTHLYHFPSSGETWTSQNNGLEQVKHLVEYLQQEAKCLTVSCAVVVLE